MTDLTDGFCSAKKNMGCSRSNSKCNAKGRTVRKQKQSKHGGPATRHQDLWQLYTLCTKSGLRTDWIPTGYRTIHSAHLSRMWKKFREVPGFEITTYPRRPDIYFDTSLSIHGRIAALIEAQRSIEADRLIGRKRKADYLDEA